MPLIFAIDSDKRQSAQLASLLRSHVHADLVQSASAAEGLEILQGRVPDLILTSSLLSPRDETALDNHLRELGVAAAHVQTLTIPVIAGASSASSKKKKPAGMLAALRREKNSAAKTSGCDPEVFAREVQLYLERAMEQREALRAVLPPVLPAPVVDAEAAESLIAAATSVEPAAEPPTVVMLAPTVVAVVVKQPQETQPAAVLAEPEPELLPPPVLEETPSLILPEPVAEPAPVLSIFSVIRDADPQPETAPLSLPDFAPPPDLLLVTPAVEPIVEIDPVDQLLAVPAATLEAAEQLLVAPVSVPAPEPVAPVSVPAPEPEPAHQAAPPETDAIDLLALDLAALDLPELDLPAPDLTPVSIEPAETATPVDTLVLESVAEPAQGRSWSFEASGDESLQLDRLMQLVGENGHDAKPPTEHLPQTAAASDTPPAVTAEESKAVEPVDAGPPPAGLVKAEFADLLAPPPTRIADAIRMPEPPVPTVDMLECHDLDALADDFAAAGLTAELPEPTAAVERSVEPEVELVVEPVAPVTAVTETVEEVPVVEAAAVAETVEDVPVVETASVARILEEVPAVVEEEPVVVAAPFVEDVVRVIEDPPVPAIVEEAPVVEAAPAPATADAPSLVWSWLEEKAPSLADLLSTRLGSAPTLEETFAPAIATPPIEHAIEEPISAEAVLEEAVLEEAALEEAALEEAALEEPALEEAAPEEPVLVEEVYDPVAAASWNLAATVASVEELDASPEPAPEPTVEAVAIDPVHAAPVEPTPAEEPMAVAETATWDPVSAAAWQAAVTPVLAVPPVPEPAQAAAAPEPEAEGDPQPAVDAAPGPDVPLLDPEVLAILGMAAHRAGLDALETLDAAPPEPPRATASERPGLRKSRNDRFGQNRQRRDTRNSRKAQRKEERPAQDEWGMFDPAQCGPDALFDDEEWSDDDDRPSRSRASTY